MEMDCETRFLAGLIELQYGQAIEAELKKDAQKVSWAKGWPGNKEAFWNAEAFMWERKISREKRELIRSELLFLEKGLNLDLGCGAYSYINSVGLDLSPKMLDFNSRLRLKIQGDLEKNLPLKDKEFDSVTGVFVLNYVQHYNNLLLEIRRVIKEKGILVLVLFSKEINSWQKQQEVHHFSAVEWKKIISRAGFQVDFYEKEELWFFKCQKR